MEWLATWTRSQTVRGAVTHPRSLKAHPSPQCLMACVQPPVSGSTPTRGVDGVIECRPRVLAGVRR